MASTEADFPGSRKTSSWSAFKTLMWDPSKRAFLGRGGKSWFLIIVFYIIFYGCLAGFFLASMYVFFLVGDDKIPTRVGYDSPMKKNPGMGFRPQLGGDSTTIKFQQGVNESYYKYTQSISKFLEAYSDDRQKNNIDCANLDADERNSGDNKNKACRFDLDFIHQSCAPPDYGFGEGQPCILLKLNKVFNWVPEFFSNDSSAAPSEGAHHPDSIGITCEGAYDDDKGKVGPIEVFPSGGFPGYYYPYMNQEGYVSPLVFVRFTKPTTDTSVSIWCKAWAENINVHRGDRAGSIVFHMQVE